ERNKLLKDLRLERLWGIEANETIARIARINMYLHQDGGSRIYRADALDKGFVSELNVVGEAHRDFEELKRALSAGDVRFDCVLTNPPFAIRSEEVGRAAHPSGMSARTQGQGQDCHVAAIEHHVCGAVLRLAPRKGQTAHNHRRFGSEHDDDSVR